ncbi:Myb-like_DNA-binding domain-containing protein [Hexamita inflata]|uniref:Myb-like DNA-binding domain-containing protein n=1 Tax=Hexamita inflata TaxID=28002 RepID=A0AA86NEM1_9EUKA|nr:Myb-like DNA-binding domain-containing protein [Hexamita inflata]
MQSKQYKIWTELDRQQLIAAIEQSKRKCGQVDCDVKMVKYHTWTEQEVNMLLKCAEIENKNWEVIEHNYFPNLSSHQIHAKFAYLQQQQTRANIKLAKRMESVPLIPSSLSLQLEKAKVRHVQIENRNQGQIPEATPQISSYDSSLQLVSQLMSILNALPSKMNELFIVSYFKKYYNFFFIPLRYIRSYSKYYNIYNYYLDYYNILIHVKYYYMYYYQLIIIRYWAKIGQPQNIISQQKYRIQLTSYNNYNLYDISCYVLYKYLQVKLIFMFNLLSYTRYQIQTIKLTHSIYIKQNFQLESINITNRITNSYLQQNFSNHLIVIGVSIASGSIFFILSCSVYFLMKRMQTRSPKIAFIIIS